MFQEKIIDNRKRFKYWKKLWNILGKDKKLGVKRCRYLISETKSM